MGLVWTASMWYGGPDRVDITTRKTHEHGQWFAPDWETMVKPYLYHGMSQKRYEKAYIEYMRKSYAQHKPSWEWLLSQLEVTLVCFCTPKSSGGVLFCHRRILVEQILTKFPGVIDKGERVKQETW